LFQMCRTWTQESVQGFTLIQTVILQDKLSQIKVIRVTFNLSTSTASHFTLCPKWDSKIKRPLCCLRCEDIAYRLH
jgi:hypothetical protein